MAVNGLAEFFHRQSTVGREKNRGSERVKSIGTSLCIIAMVICPGNLLWLFALGICRGYLPWEFAAAICRGDLPQLFAVAICCEYLPWVCFVYVNKPFFCVSESFSFVKKLF